MRYATNKNALSGQM